MAAALPGTAAPIGVMVVDDHPIVRHGVVSLLEDDPRITVVADVRSGEEAVALYPQHRPEITIMDLRLPGMSGVEAIRAIRAIDPASRFVVLTTYDGDEDIHQALQAGAASYVLKDSFCDEIVETLLAVHAGQRRLPEAVSRRLAERSGDEVLTPREAEVLRLLAKGLSNQEIAEVLGVVPGTVKIHVARILAKLEVDDRTAAVITALQRGLVHL